MERKNLVDETYNELLAEKEKRTQFLKELLKIFHCIETINSNEKSENKKILSEEELANYFTQNSNLIVNEVINKLNDTKIKSLTEMVSFKISKDKSFVNELDNIEKYYKEIEKNSIKTNIPKSLIPRDIFEDIKNREFYITQLKNNSNFEDILGKIKTEELILSESEGIFKPTENLKIIFILGQKLGFYKLATLDLPDIGEIYCSGCIGLLSLNAPNAEIAQCNFCTGLKYVNMPNCKEADFSKCYELSQLNVPEAKIVNCSECRNLTDLTVTKAEEVNCSDCISLINLTAPSALYVNTINSGIQKLDSPRTKQIYCSKENKLEKSFVDSLQERNIITNPRELSFF